MFMQDIAGDSACDITEDVIIENGKITIPGELIHFIGTSVQLCGDTSEPGCVIKLI